MFVYGIFPDKAQFLHCHDVVLVKNTDKLSRFFVYLDVFVLNEQLIQHFKSG